MKVLIVDDNDSSRKLLRLILVAEGHDMVEASDGQEALEKLESSPVDAVISDILMPRMDGYRFCYEARRKKSLQNLPIIIYSSTYTSPTEESVALNLGADRFLRKPAPAAVILRTLSDVTSQPRDTSLLHAPAGELQVLKQYSERLVHKLEEKNLELEGAQEKLSAAYDNLEQSECKFRELVDQAPIGICQSTPDGRLIAANAAFIQMFGYESPADILGIDVPRDLYVEAADRAGALRRYETGEGSEDFEVRLKKKDGAAIWVETDGRAVRDGSGRVQRYEIFMRDISARKIAEEEAQQSAETAARGRRAKVTRDLAIGAALAIAFAPLTFWMLRQEAVWFDAVVAGLVFLVTLASVFSYRRLKDVRSEIFARQGVERALRFLRGDLENRVEARTLELRAANQSLRTEVEERRHAEVEMRRSEERFRRLFESNTIGIAIADLTGATLEANDAYLGMFGYTREDFHAGRVHWGTMTPPEYRAVDQAAVESLQRTGVASPWEKEMLRKNGTRVPVLLGVAMLEASATCITYVVDLSKPRQLEKQLRQAQKMEAVGQLAGGVAHDFNNLLTAILGYTELLEERLGEGTAGFEELEEIRKAGERAAGLTRQLLAFSRRQVLESRVLDLNAIVGDLEKMLRRLIGEDIDLVTTLDPSLSHLRADAGEVEQIIMNLVVNSRDAMPQGGKITIETANVELDEEYARNHISTRPGQYVMLAVSDTGIGMDAETQSHIFEPFFTTKGKDKGTGLGLSTVYGIVKQSGGWIWVYSEPSRGTTAKVYFPEVDENAETVPRRIEATSAAGSETILLAEDEAPVRKLARKALENLGYTVLEASRGEEALSIARSHAGPIHLVLTDVVMPEMGGADLASRVQELRPEARVLYMSGYTDDAIIRHKVLERGTHFLQKPFTPASLARKVREALS
jgi:two-component system cell cycle sensor histidine kinase/response regulator CckA